MAEKTYRQWLWENSPTWLKGKVAARLVGAMGLMADVLAETQVEALFARFLYTDDFPEDALRRIGSERMMPRYGNESAASYTARLKRAWTSWTFAGTRHAVLEQLAAAGYTAQLYENWQWNWDGNTADWSRFWVVIVDAFGAYKPSYWGAPDLRYGEFRYGTTLGTLQYESLRRLIRAWKAGHTRCEFIIIPIDSASWEADLPDGSWGDPDNRNPNAAYIPG